MSLQQLQDNILAIAAEELKWTIRFCSLAFYADFEFVPKRDCDGSGTCLAKSKNGCYKPKATGCNCQPTVCPNCSEVVAQWELEGDPKGYCSDCDMAMFQSKEAFDNRKTRLSCDECLSPLDRRYHRLDYKNSNHEWVRQHMHERCFYEWKLEDMSELDEHCDCNDNLNCKHKYEMY